MNSKGKIVGYNFKRVFALIITSVRCDIMARNNFELNYTTFYPLYSTVDLLIMEL